MTSGRVVVVLVNLLVIFKSISSDTYNVKIGTETHINIVDTKFLSFTIDPEFLFSNDEKYQSKECICMASALSPSFLRIAGPSTSLMNFNNATLTLTHEIETPKEDRKFENRFRIGDIIFPKRSSFFEEERSIKKRSTQSLSVSSNQWKKFMKWSNDTGFDIVFGLNNQEKMESGVWDPNTALGVLTIADKAGINNIVWQLGYECSNQSIEDYLFDLETLLVMADSFPGRSRWRVVAGDVSPCLSAESKSDFKDFVSLSNDRLDAIFLDGNSSSREIEKMTERDRLKLLRILSNSNTPLWIADHFTPVKTPEFQFLRAADWMSSLGQSARNGFAVYFRELNEKEMFEPSLSFYMALLFKNLVGEKVLNVEFDTPSQKVSLYAHCTSLRHKQVPGAVTIFGMNVDDEPARFSLKLSKREEGGDIMQFILGLDNEGNILVNGQEMYYEGDIKPVVKRVRPYKTLLLNLPPKSFGFWVLANTKTDACYDVKANEEDIEFIKDESTDEANLEAANLVRSKRSLVTGQQSIESPDFFDISDENEVKKYDLYKHINKQFESINKDIKSIQKTFRSKLKKFGNPFEVITNEIDIDRKKRQIEESDTAEKKLSNKSKKSLLAKFTEKKSLIQRDENKPKVNWLGKLLHLNAKFNYTRNILNERVKKLRSQKYKEYKRINNNKLKKVETKNAETEKEIPNVRKIIVDDINLKRKRRSILRGDTLNVDTEDIMTNEIDSNNKNLHKFEKNVYQMNQKIDHLPRKFEKKLAKGSEESLLDQILLNKKILNDNALMEISEKSNGLLKSALDSTASMLEDLSGAMNKIMSVFSILE